LVEQRQHQENHDGNPKWEISLINVTSLFEEWPAPKDEAFKALQERIDIAKSWFMHLSATLIKEGVIQEVRDPKVGSKIPRKLDAKSLYKVALLAQALRDQGLLFIKSPQRTYAVKEFIEVMRAEPDLC